MLQPDLDAIPGAADLSGVGEWCALLAVLGEGIVTRQPAAAVVQAAEGLDDDRGLDMLALLDQAGWIELTESDEGEPTVCLSPLAALRLGLRVVERGAQACWTDDPEIETEWPRWYKPESTMDPDDHGGDSWEASVADPRPGPAELAERSEAAARYQPDPYPELAVREPPRPTLILGIDVPWFAVVGVAHRTERTELPNGARALDQRLTSRPCPGCGGRRLPPHAACVYPGCDRWGLDRQFQPHRDEDVA